MTRNEAIRKLKMCGSLEANKALDMLEALGLIKFDQEVTAFMVIKRNLEFYEGAERQANRIYNDLIETGFLKCR